MKKLTENSALFATGAAGYSIIEILWRGYTHWSMAAAGGICLVLLYRIFGKLSASSLPLKCIVGGGVITTVEFLFGWIVNLRMGLHVWDYSSMPGNLFGQVCPQFSILWVLLSLPVVGLTSAIRKRFGA